MPSNIRDFIWKKIDDRIFCEYIVHHSNDFENKKIKLKMVFELLKFKTVKTNLDFARREHFKKIDSNGGAKVKGEQMMFNGFILTSAIDLSIISFLVIIVEIVLFFIKSNFDCIMLFISAIYVILSPFIIFSLIIKHLKLMNTQLKSNERL